MGPKYILDANLIVLFAVGLVDARRVPSHKRLKSYRPEDIYLLEIILSAAADRDCGITKAGNHLSPDKNCIDKPNHLFHEVDGNFTGIYSSLMSCWKNY